PAYRGEGGPDIRELERIAKLLRGPGDLGGAGGPPRRLRGCVPAHFADEVAGIRGRAGVSEQQPEPRRGSHPSDQKRPDAAICSPGPVIASSAARQGIRDRPSRTPPSVAAATSPPLPDPPCSAQWAASARARISSSTARVPEAPQIARTASTQ